LKVEIIKPPVPEATIVLTLTPREAGAIKAAVSNQVGYSHNNSHFDSDLRNLRNLFDASAVPTWNYYHG